MSNKKILIAIDSPTMRTLLANYLKEKDYEIIEAEDGLKAIKLLYSECPSTVIVHTELTGINGYCFSRIVKNTPEISNTIVILVSSEKNPKDNFWVEHSKCDAFYIPTADNIHILYEILEKKFSNIKNNIQHKNLLTLDEKNEIEIITKAYDKEIFELYVIRDAYNISSYIFDIEILLSKISGTISNICSYDALGIIINDEEFTEYYDRTDLISEEDFNEFKNICHRDFKNHITNKKNYDWSSGKVYENLIELFSPGTKKISDYSFFPLDDTKKFPITIHIASCIPDNLSPEILTKLDFLTEIYSMVIEKAIHFSKTQNSEERMRKQFNSLLPKNVINSILSGDDSVKTPEQRHVAILVADIRNFTSLSEINNPENVIEFLNKYFQKMSRIIKKHGGTIDKFMGDAVMALFGAQESFTYNACHAANAALEMHEEIVKMDTNPLVLPENYKFTVGIGVHYGNPIMGYIGSDEKKEYTVIGDDVNLVSRIESLTKQYGVPVIITEDVKKDLENAKENLASLNKQKDSIPSPHLTRHLDNVKVKGKSIAVGIYEITGELNKYSNEFLKLYEKSLFQYLLGNFNGALDYLKQAELECPSDKATKVMIKRCTEFIRKKPENWTGAVSLTEK